MNAILTAAVLSVLLPLPDPPAAPASTRTLQVSVLDEKGKPVASLGPNDFAVVENGVARPLVAVDAEKRPLKLALIVDTSEPIGPAYRLYLSEAVVSFLNSLPADAQAAVWTTGDRPTRVADFDTPRLVAVNALKRVFPRGANRLLDAVSEVSKLLRGEEARRTALVLVTGRGAGFTDVDRRRVVDEAAGIDVVYGLSFQEGEAPFQETGGGELTQFDYDFVLATLAERTGGIRENLLSGMAVKGALLRVSADLQARYRLTYAAAPGRQGKVEVTVAVPGARVRVPRLQE